ncbi:hypothetical protein BN136_3674 [Cronobacter universalis NCTC 9529]|nr:hypothetical protein BN136_3674 [Cronobacter universalis NCTC 9529]
MHPPGACRAFLQRARQARAKAVAQGTILRLDVKDFNL